MNLKFRQSQLHPHKSAVMNSTLPTFQPSPGQDSFRISEESCKLQYTFTAMNIHVPVPSLEFRILGFP